MIARILASRSVRRVGYQSHGPASVLRISGVFLNHPRKQHGSRRSPRAELPRFGRPQRTLYRIHGSNEPWTIGTQVSSGCIRMRNEDVMDLYERVKIGTKVIVM
jgi:hypothetical protein